MAARDPAADGPPTRAPRPNGQHRGLPGIGLARDDGLPPDQIMAARTTGSAAARGVAGAADLLVHLESGAAEPGGDQRGR
jgi:hypothetical protein